LENTCPPGGTGNISQCHLGEKYEKVKRKGEKGQEKGRKGKEKEKRRSKRIK
jgi:hypothetical protein